MHVPLCDDSFRFLNDIAWWPDYHLFKEGLTLTLQETRSIHDSMNIPKIEFITYIYISYYQSSINFQLSPNLAGFPDILN